MRKLLLLLLLLPVVAFAKPQVLNWQWPTQDCDGLELNQADWFSAEIIYDTEPMPMPSDTAGPCDAAGDPNGPPTATVVPITTPVTSTTLNLQPGIVYYARIRVCYNNAENCSSWSAEASFMVPYGKPGPAIWLN